MSRIHRFESSISKECFDMHKAKLISAMALTILSATSQAGPQEALTLPTSLWFDGYCDGFTNIVKVSRVSYSATYDATAFCDPVYFNAPAGGASGRNLAGGSLLGQGVALTIESYPYYGVTVTAIVNGDGTWTVTDTLGNVGTRGTWTAGTLATPRGSKTIFSR
jgi:hypothetical protein